jgi:hypothetical protein
VYTYYSLLHSAVSAAISGQTVEVFTDFTYTGSTPIDLKNGVDINFNGHTYTTNSILSPSINVFRDNGVAVNCKLLNGIIKKISPTGINVRNNTMCLYLSGPSTIETNCTFINSRGVVSFDNASCYVIGGRYISLSGSSFGVIYNEGIINNTYSETLSFQTGSISYNIYSTGGTVNNSTIYSSIISNVSNGILVYDGSVNNCDINIHYTGIDSTNSTINNCSVNTVDGVGVLLRNGSTLSNSSVRSQISTDGAIGVTGGGEIKDSSAFNTVGDGVSVTGSSTNIKNSYVYGNGYGVIYSNGGTIENSSVYSLTNEGVSISGSTATESYIRNCSIRSLANIGVTINTTSSRGTLNLSNSVVESLWNNTAGDAVKINTTTSAHTIVNNHLITTNATAHAIDSTTSKSIYYVNNVFNGMTTALFNIVQLAPNNQDNRGNTRI